MSEQKPKAAVPKKPPPPPEDDDTFLSQEDWDAIMNRGKERDVIPNEIR